MRLLQAKRARQQQSWAAFNTADLPPCPLRITPFPKSTSYTTGVCYGLPEGTVARLDVIFP